MLKGRPLGGLFFYPPGAILGHFPKIMGIGAQKAQTVSLKFDDARDTCVP